LRKHNPIFLIISILLAFTLAGCSGTGDGNTQPPEPLTSPPATEGEPPETKTAVIRGLDGASAMGMVRLFTEIRSLSDELPVDFGILDDPDEISQGLTEGTIDVAALPVTDAARLYSETDGGIRLLSVNALGLPAVISKEDAGISSLGDLKGGLIAISTNDALEGIVFEYILSKNGMDPEKDIELSYVDNPEELLMAGEVLAVVTGQPFATDMAAKEGLGISIDLSEEWTALHPESEGFPAECLVATTSFVEKYRSELLQLLVFHNQSVNWVNEDRETAACLIVDFGIMDDLETAEAAIEKSGLRFIPANAAKDMVGETLEKLYGYNPKSTGFALPGEDFYFAN
jgi:NitT/TauT family transport system substrate-binding protein